jgi:hypothetical protein
MSVLEYESQFISLALQNSAGMKDIASVYSNPTPGYTDLFAVFGTGVANHYLTLQADGAKIYYAIGSVPTGGIGTAMGSGTTQSWPIPDGVTERGRIISGREVGTGLPTGTFATNTVQRYVQYMSGVTATLRMYRSSIGPTQDTLEFKAP